MEREKSLSQDNYSGGRVQKTRIRQEIRAARLRKYGKKFGESIFKGKIMIGMTQKMLEDEFNAPRAKDSFSEYNEYWTWSNLMVAIDKKTKKRVNEQIIGWDRERI